MSSSLLVAWCATLVAVRVAVPGGAEGQAALAGNPLNERRMVHAARTDAPVRVDGQLDEPAWRTAPAVGEFVQIDPGEGEPTAYPTEVRVLFDATHVYVGARLTDPAGRAGVRAPSLRRDFASDDSDVFGVVFDTFLDGRNAVAFMTNPHGAQRDLMAFDDQGRLTDVEWDAVWQVRTAISDSGWTVEMAIPWATLRYPPGASVWGVNFLRIARRSNEISGWSPWPRNHSVLRMSHAGHLLGLEPPPPSANVRVQPYSAVRAERVPAATGYTRQVRPELGGDAKWAITPSTVLDLSVNTDFAQADADIQQVNLSRFSVFFPERRPFFLENAGLFTIGGGSFGGEPFFSRRIGLDGSGRPVPIEGGARLTRRTMAQNGGVFVVRQRESADGVQPPTTFGIGRLSRNIGTQHRLGALVVSRIEDGSAGSPARGNTVAALDGFARPTRSSFVRAMAARSTTTGTGGEGTHLYMHTAINARQGYFGWVQSYVSEDYEASAGFVGRGNLMLTSPAMTLDWRPAWRPSWVRAFTPGVSVAMYHRASDFSFQEGSVFLMPVQWTFQDGGFMRLWARPEWQRLESTFTPVPGMPIDAGSYQFAQYGVTYRPDLSRAWWAWVTLASGGYYDGRRDQAIVRVRAAHAPRIAVTLDYEGNRLSDVGSAGVQTITHLWYPDLRVAVNPRLHFSTLWQYSSVSRVASWNGRLAWEFRPLSYVYLVYHDRALRDPAGTSAGVERRLVAKLVWLGQL